MHSTHPNPPTVRHGPNPVGGRDLVIGDLHGEFDTLEHALDELEFRPTRDRLFTVGDLIDRGPRSADALEWLETGRFAGSVRGNHEQMMTNAIVGDEAAFVRKSGPGSLWLCNGADWWYDSDETETARERGTRAHERPLAQRWLSAIGRMPYLATIEYGSRSIGLVYAPGALAYVEDWTELGQKTETECAHQNQYRYSDLIASLLRDRAREWAEQADDPDLNPPVEGVDLVITGHCPALWPRWARANVVRIDTGVHYDELGHLTVAEIQEGLTLHRFPRTERFSEPKETP